MLLRCCTLQQREARCQSENEQVRMMCEMTRATTTDSGSGWRRY